MIRTTTMGNKVSMAPLNPIAAKQFSAFLFAWKDVKPECSACGLHIEERDGAMKVPGLAGVYCSVECVETQLFGHDRCRWCGTPMDKPYLSVASRLCSDDCATNYHERVRGDRSAKLGTGVRLMRWLSEHQPKVFAMLAAGENSKPGALRNCEVCEADISHLRERARFCSDGCRKRFRRQTPEKS